MTLSMLFKLVVFFDVELFWFALVLSSFVRDVSILNFFLSFVGDLAARFVNK